MIHRWQWLAFLHWPLEPDVVAPLLPHGLEVDTFDGLAWVGLIPFRMQLWLPGLRAARRTFPETNVRTYVRGPDGRRGIWFFSLDAADPAAVSTARLLYGLPYFWSRMRIAASGREIGYFAERRTGRGVRSAVRIRVDDPIGGPSDLTDLEDFLVSRWWLYGLARRGLTTVPAEHPPWVLWKAGLIELDDGLAPASRLPVPDGEPLVHYSPGVEVRIGRRRTLWAGAGSGRA